MSKMDTTAVAVNAAGIADALRVLQAARENGEARLEELTRAHEDWCGVMLQIAEAGEVMERFRAKQGPSATWGDDLPYLYEVWDAIAQGLWDHLGAEPVDVVVHRSIKRAMSVIAA
jgi:hypothetical protein